MEELEAMHMAASELLAVAGCELECGAAGAEAVWSGLCSWLAGKYRESRSFVVPGLGVVYFRKHKMGIKLPAFRLANDFADRWAVHGRTSARPALSIQASSVSLQRYASEWLGEQRGTFLASDHDVVRAVIDGVVHGFGALAAEGATAALSLGFALLVAEGKHVKLHFQARQGHTRHGRRAPVGAGIAAEGTGVPQLRIPRPPLEGAKRLGADSPNRSMRLSGRLAVPPHGEEATAGSDLIETVPAATARTQSARVAPRGGAAAVVEKAPVVGQDDAQGGSSDRTGAEERPGSASVPALLGVRREKSLDELNRAIRRGTEQPPLLQTYSHTRASVQRCKTTSVGFLTDVIGSNYSLESRRLCIDPVGKSLRLKKRKLDSGASPQNATKLLDRYGFDGRQIREGELSRVIGLVDVERPTPRGSPREAPEHRLPFKAQDESERSHAAPERRRKRRVGKGMDFLSLGAFAEQVRSVHEQDRRGPAAAASEVSEAELQRRYCYYVEHAVAEEEITPLKREWLENVASLLPISAARAYLSAPQTSGDGDGAMQSAPSEDEEEVPELEEEVGGDGDGDCDTAGSVGTCDCAEAADGMRAGAADGPEEPGFARLKESIDAMTEDIRKDYVRSIRKATLDYALKNPAERERLRIPHIPAGCEPMDWGWGSAKPLFRAPPFWRNSFASAHELLERKLSLTHPLIGKLQALWADFENDYFVDVPVSDEEALKTGWTPLHVEDFMKAQMDKARQVRERLMHVWHPAAIKIFSEAAAQQGEAKSGLPCLADMPQAMLHSLFESAATLMGKQIRELVTESLRRLQSFFDRFELLAQPEPQQQQQQQQHGGAEGSESPLPRSSSPSSPSSSLLAKAFSSPTTVHGRSAFQNSLVVSPENEIQFETTLTRMKECVKEVIDFVVTCMNRVVRLERKGVGLSLTFPDEDDGEGNGGKPAADANILADAEAPEGEYGSAIAQKSMYIITLSTGEEAFSNIRTRIMSVMDASDGLCQSLIVEYEGFRYILAERESLLERIQGVRQTLEALQAEIDTFKELQTKLAATARPKVTLGIQTTECDALNRRLDAEMDELVNLVLTAVVQNNIHRNLIVCKAFTAATSVLAKSPESSQELVEAEVYVREFQGTELDVLLNDVQEVKGRLSFLMHNKRHIGADLLRPMGVTFSWVRKIDGIVNDAQNQLRKARDKMEAQFKVNRDTFIQQLSGVETTVEELKGKGDMRYIRSQVRVVEGAREQIEKAKTRAAALNEEEERLGLTHTDFVKLRNVEQALEPYETLWKLADRFQKQFNRWTNGVVFTLDSEDVERDLMDMFRQALQLSQRLAEESPPAASCAELIRQRLDEFRPSLPLLAAVSNDGLRERHWARMSDVLGFPIEPDESMTLVRLQELEVGNHIDKLEAISEGASKEQSIESSLAKMKQEWQPLEFTAQAYKDSGTFILQGANVEDLQTVLDDHIVKTQTMRGSPHCMFIDSEMAAWETFLTYTRDLIEAWLKVQASWLYLDPIFASEDIMKQMPSEGNKFQGVSTTWREVMDVVHRSSKCVAVAKVDGLKNRFVEMNEALEEINKGLSSYLETKRLYFSRFFFLSNDELLEILAETKDPTRVQPFLKKCFEGIAALDFAPNPATAADSVITHIVSAEKEQVKLTTSITPKEAKGAVEKWLLQLEEEMCRTIKFVTKQSLTDYPAKPRERWILDWPGQCVLAVGSAYWTREVEQALRKKGTAGLAEYLGHLESQLGVLVKLVRGNLSKLERATLSALAVIDVHARDVTHQLVDSKVTSPHDFDWTSQLRYYWEEDTLNIKIIASKLEYGYEYLGNSSRLVITPLTDRCYRTLMGALHLQYGGAPEGPAGTGKTETTKDLAKALARQCVVFNCSDGLDYLAMAKFFKGLASSGAWACFDEFNRIELEVLSVIAQQISSIQRAIAAKLHMFDFEGTRIQLRWTANVFITMNPGYAGRSELPDNLKALFRTVAMMVPDYAMIAEIILFSYGYADSRSLANKIVTTYKLCSEQLSSQDHYDYGMRAVISVLKAAGALKRQFPDEKEDIIVLRSICDVNLAKFISEDLPLFHGIISDLFPGVVVPDPDYEHLLGAARLEVDRQHIEPVPAFMEKVVQLYEMVVVRHGLMVVGPPLAGKTMCWKVLQGALTELCRLEQMPCKLGDHELATDVMQINPKAVTMGELYGCFDAVSHEWSDGILAKTYRDASKATDGRRKWILFDGPVDAVWIENLNTVLDDNKKLCLMSGEIIAMSEYMNMIFEPMDLAVASPATVSRCGMVYMEPDKLGWQPMVDSWSKTLGLGPGVLEHIDNLFQSLVDPCLEFVRKSTVQLAPASGLMLVRALTQLLGSLLAQEVASFHSDEAAKDKQPGGAAKGTKKHTPSAEEAPADGTPTPAPSDSGEGVNGGVELDKGRAEAQFLFAVVWSIGATLDSPSREAFDAFFREALAKSGTQTAGVTIAKAFPREGLVYDYFVEGGAWKRWESRIEAKPEFPPDESFNSIIVPTKDTARYTFLLDLAVRNQKAMLMVGPTGTGKSVYTVQHLLNGLDREKFQLLFLAFSAQTSTSQVQSIVDAKLDRRRKGVYGPSGGKKFVVFLDDVNMPQPETYGAQPPLELLRQAFKYDGWYDTKDLTYRTMEDCNYVAAMGPPGGGRNQVSPRFLRHFHMVGVTEAEDSTLVRIFSNLMDWYLGVNQGAAPHLLKVGEKAVLATLDLYRASVAQLLPTPSKSHYLFNMRDFSRVIQGMTLASFSGDVGNAGEDDAAFVSRLWTHECLRVFGDRLVDDTDRNRLIKDMLSPALKKHFGKSFVDTFASVGSEPGNGAGSVPRRAADWATARRVLFGKVFSETYEEIAEVSQLKALCEDKLQQYNQMSPKPMDLVMFLYALEHTTRINRIISIPGGHALLVGVGGSGRQSLTRLAAFMRGFEVVQIELSRNYAVADWHADLRKLIMLAGGRGTSTVFLMSDSQIKFESFVEDINSLLNSGEVPNMLAPDERAEICELARPGAKAERRKVDTADALWAFVIERVRARLHIVLAFSPIGDTFRARIRKFPSLVNCCVIDWFSEWPQDALTSVAERFLDEVCFTGAAPTDKTASMKKRGAVMVPGVLKQMCVELCKKFHISTMEYARKFANELRRHYYVTPTSYLELINTFKTMLTKKRSEVGQARDRYNVGLEKLQFTEESVHVMQKELQDLQPVLVRTTHQTEEMMKAVEKEQTEADKVAQVVKKEEAVANEKAKSAKAIKDECEKDLGEAMPILEAALAALNTLSKNDITEVKSMKSPPDGVKLVMEAMCIMLGVKPIKIKDPNDQSKKINDYWEPAKRQLLSDPKLLQSLIDYDKDNIEPKIVQKATTYTNNPDFDPEKIKKASRAAYGLCSWVRAMVEYDRVAKVVAPKRAALAEAEQEFETVMMGLREKQAELTKIENRVAGLAQQLDQCRERKKDLEKQVEDCTAKLDRAEKLISGLGGEKTRWASEKRSLTYMLERLIGNVLVCSGIIAYLGPFTVTYRRDITTAWVKAAIKFNIPCSSPSELNLVQTLGDAVKIRHWNQHGLPIDDYSVENGIILSNARRWPLLIDPQGQANKWLRSLEAEHDLKVCKLSDSNYLRTMENAVQFGKPVLLENVGETLPPALEPLLLKQIIKRGGVSSIKLGDSVIEYSENFRFYMTTKLRSPHYLPEVSVKVTLVNFMITPVGLEDQLLGIVVAKERPDLEAEKSQLIIETSKNKNMLKEIEDKILDVMSSSQGNILEDATAIEVLSKSQAVAKDISEKQAIADKTSFQIDEARQGYVPIARRAATMFFCVADLAYVDPMYQYSLNWFVDLYVASIVNSKKPGMDPNNIILRLKVLEGHFMDSLYRNICRSLFEKDKLLFSFLLCVRILQEQAPQKPSGGAAGGQAASPSPEDDVKAPAEAPTPTPAAGRGKEAVDPLLFRFLLTGGVRTGEVPPNPCAAWLSDKAWSDFDLFCATLSILDADRGAALRESVGEKSEEWSAFVNQQEPEAARFPDGWDSRLNQLEQLCALRCLRTDRVVPGVSNFVKKMMGEQFVEPPPFDLLACWEDSRCTTPLVFVLSPGSDPMASLSGLADQLGTALASLSLGQGQGALAEKLIWQAAIKGSWVVLQNCHLYPSWMPKLEQILEELVQCAKSGESADGSGSEGDAAGAAAGDAAATDGRGGENGDVSGGRSGVAINPNFRLWLTSYPSEKFPVSILQNGIKMTNEPPKGLRANLVRSFTSNPICDDEFFETCLPSRSAEFKKLLFGLCFFHAVIQERRSFGPLGWNIPYEFNESDLRISVRQLRMFLEDSEDRDLPFKALTYTIGECNYGGRVTDENDRRTLRALLSTYINRELVENDNYQLSEGDQYLVPKVGSHSQYLDHLRELPQAATPDVYGMHANADITKAQNETMDLFRSILSTQPRSESGAGGATPESIAEELARDILGKLPPKFDLELAKRQYPISYSESMNTVLCQELERFNGLTAVVRSSLQTLIKATQGLVVMSDELERVFVSLLDGTVPSLWKTKSYPSLKRLVGYVADLQARLAFYQAWLERGPPVVFWYSGLFLPSSFNTAVLQNYARKHQVPIDTVHFDFHVLETPDVSLTLKPEDGAYINGLFIEGARWDSEARRLAECLPKVLYDVAPTIHLLPATAATTTDQSDPVQWFSAPLYRTCDRRGVLSTTGRSTNYVLNVCLPSANPSSHWVRRGVALITQLNE